MNNEDGKIWYGMGLDNSQLRRDGVESQRIFSDIGNKAATEGSRIDKAYQQAGNSITGLDKAILGFGGVAVLASLGNQIVQTRGNFQQLEIAFTTLLQSKGKAEDLMAQMVQTARTTPFRLTDVAGGARQLLAYGFAATEVNDTLIKLGNVASGLGLPLERLTYLYGTTRTQGRLYARDMLQFTTSGIPMLQQMADMYGKTTGEITQMVTAGKIGFSDVEKVIGRMTDKGGMFFNLMQNQSKSFIGQLSNIKDNIDIIFNELGKGSEGFINGALKGTQFLLNHYEQVGKALIGLVATYGTYRVAMALVTMGANRMTVAELAHYAALVIAKKGQDALNASMLKNPYVLAAVAIVALVAGVWALANADTAAEKAQKEYNKIKEEASSLEEKHKTKIEALIATATNQALADLTRVDALETLKKEYPKIFKEYDIELLKLADILAIKKQIAEEESNKIVKSNQQLYDDQLKVITGVKEKANNSANSGVILQGVWKSKLDKENALLAKYGEDVEKDRVNKWTANLNKLTDQQIKAELEARERLAFAVKKSGKEKAVGKLSGSVDGTFTVEELQAQTASLKVELAKRNETVTSFTKLQKGYLDDLADAEKKLEDLKTKNLTKTAYTAQFEDLQGKVDAAKAGLKAIGAEKVLTDNQKAAADKKEVTAAQKSADIDAKITNNTIKEELARRQAILNGQKDVLNAQEDGYAKQYALAKINHEQRLLDIDKQAQERLVAQQEAEKLAWQDKGSKGTFKPSMTLKDTSVIDGMNIVETIIFTADTDAVKKGLNDAYASFDEKRRAIDAKYDADVLAAKGLLTGDDLNTRLAEIESKRKADKKQSYEDEASEIVKTTDLFIELFSDASDKSVQDIKKVKEEIETLYNYLKKTKPEDITDQIIGGKTVSAKSLKTIKSDPTQMKNLKGQVTSLTDAADKGDIVFGQFGVNIKKAFEGFTKGKDGVIDLKAGVEALAGAFQNLSGFASGVTDMLDAIGTDSAKSASKSIGAVMDIASSTMQGLAQGGIVGGAIAIVTSTLTKVFEAEAAHKEALRVLDEARANQQKEYNDLLLQQNDLLKKAETIFGTDVYGQMKGNVEQIYKYNKVLKGSLSDLSKATVQTGSHKTGLFGWGGEKADYSSLLKTYPKLIDGQGNLNKELAQSILDNQTLTDSSKKALQAALDYTDEYEAALASMNEYLTSVFGELGNNMMTSITDNLDNEKAALDDLAGYVAKTMEKLMQDIAYSIFFADMFADLSKQVQDIYKDNSTSDEEKASLIQSTMAAFYNGVGDQMAKTNDFFKRMQEEAAKNGFDLWGSDTTRTGASKGAVTASQESVDQNNGLLTNMQGHTYSIMSDFKVLIGISNQMLAHLAGIDTNTGNIDNNTKRLEAIETNMASVDYNMLSVRKGIERINDVGITMKRLS